MKTLLTIIGILVLAMGLLWMGQGAGYVRWPAESFMISQVQWVYYGAVTAAVGLLLIVISRRR
jgi:membrane protein implicated in regulation of membrane protease activity